MVIYSQGRVESIWFAMSEMMKRNPLKTFLISNSHLAPSLYNLFAAPLTPRATSLKVQLLILVSKLYAVPLKLVRPYFKDAGWPGVLRLLHDGPMRLNVRGLDFLWVPTRLNPRLLDQFVTPWDEELVLDNIPRPRYGDVCLDVGSYLGLYALTWSGLVGNGLVVALEPNPYFYAELARFVDMCGLRNIRVLRAAAWSTASRLAPSGSGNPTKVLDASDWAVEHTVTGITLDGLVAEMKLDRVNWIKIDTEGAEGEIIKGSMDIIRRLRPAFLIEIHSRANLTFICDIMHRQGYEARLIHHRRTEPGTLNAHYLFTSTTGT